MEGTLTSGKKVTASDNVIMSMPFTGSTTGATSWTPYSIPIYLTGTVRIQATCFNGAGNTAYKTTLQFHLYRNGNLIQSSGTVEGTSTNHQTLSYDFTVKCGDIINIQTTGQSNAAMYIYNVYVKGSVS